MPTYTPNFIGEADIGAAFAHTVNAPAVSTGANVLLLDRNASLITLEYSGGTIAAANINSDPPFPISITGGEIFAPTRDGLGAIYSEGAGGTDQTLRTYSRAGFALTEETATALGYHLRQWPFVPSADGSVFAAYTDNISLSDPRFRIYEGSISGGYSIVLDVPGKAGLFHTSFSNPVEGPVCSADGSMILTAHDIGNNEVEVVLYEKIASAWTATALFDAAFLGDPEISDVTLRIAPDNSALAIYYNGQNLNVGIAIIKKISGVWTLDHTVIGGYWSDFQNALEFSADSSYLIGGDAEFNDGTPVGQLYILDLATYDYTRIPIGAIFTGGGGMGSRIGGPITVSAGVEAWYAYDFDLGPLIYPIVVTASEPAEPVRATQLLGIAYSLQGADFDPSALAYRLVLRDGIAPDLVIPMQALTARKGGQPTTQTSIFARVPVEHLDDISDRIDNTILIERVLDDVAAPLFFGTITNLSPIDDRLTISAAGSKPSSGGLTRQLGRVSTLSGGSGGLRFRAELDSYMEPGDTAESDLGIIKVASVTLYFEPAHRFMEIAEDG